MTDIVAPIDGDVADPAWAADITEAVNALSPSNTPVARLIRTTQQTIATGTFTDLIWQQGDWDSHAGWSAGTNPNRWTVSVPGFYVVTAAIVWTNGGDTTVRGIRFQGTFNGGSNFESRRDYRAAVNGDVTGAFISDQIRLLAGDYVVVNVVHTHGSDLTTANGEPPTFSAALVCPI